MNTRNLRAEMVRHNISRKQIAYLCELSYSAAGERLKGNIDFKVSELVGIRDTYFPTCTLDYLAGVSDER